MIFPKGITGPTFEAGDRVNFLFDGATVTLTALKILFSNSGTNHVTRVRDFRDIDTRYWGTTDQNQPRVNLICQDFYFQDARTLQEVALGEMYIRLVEAKADEQTAQVFLSPMKFRDAMVARHDYSFHKSHMEKYALDNTWPALPNRYNGRRIPRNYLEWFVMELNSSCQPLPVQFVMVPINSRFVLEARIDLENPHCSRYTDEVLKQYEKDLFEELLNHIKIEYSPELVAQIEALNAEVLA